MIAFGAVVLVFAIIGLISTIGFVGKGVSSLVSQDSRREEYEWLIMPVVLQDPAPFSSPDSLTDSTIITAGIWRLIMNEDMSAYPTDSMNFVTVPETDVEIQIRELFGDVVYTHQTVGDAALMITYDEANKSYVFPAVPYIMAYTPDVEEIETVDSETVVLTVGYIPPGLVWQSDTDGRSYQPEAEKMMYYTLKQNENDEWQIYAVENAGLNGHDNADGSLPAEESSAPESDAAEESAAAEPESAPAESSEQESSAEGESASQEEPAA